MREGDIISTHNAFIFLILKYLKDTVHILTINTILKWDWKFIMCQSLKYVYIVIFYAKHNFFFNWAIQVSFPIINVGHAALPRPPSPHLPAHLICKSDWAFLELFRPCWNHFPCTKHFLSTLVLQSQTHFVHELAFHWYSHVWGKICLWDITKNSPSTDLDCTIPTSIQRVFMCFLFWDSFCTNI